MQIITFLGFTILVAVIAYLKTRNTDEDSSDGYFLGGRSLTVVVITDPLLFDPFIVRTDCWFKWCSF